MIDFGGFDKPEPSVRQGCFGLCAPSIFYWSIFHGSVFLSLLRFPRYLRDGDLRLLKRDVQDGQTLEDNSARWSRH